jgi:hypothetical protein
MKKPTAVLSEMDAQITEAENRGVEVLDFRMLEQQWNHIAEYLDGNESEHTLDWLRKAYKGVAIGFTSVEPSDGVSAEFYDPDEDDA